MIFDIPAEPSPPRNEQIARSILLHANRSFLERVQEHVLRFRNFWNDPETTPNEICIALGANGQRFLMSASENLEHITRLVMGASFATATTEQKNAALLTAISADDFVPRLPFTYLLNGEIRVVPQAGLDAWGRPIPAPIVTP